jgi:hypothetical protein
VCGQGEVGGWGWVEWNCATMSAAMDRIRQLRASTSKGSEDKGVTPEEVNTALTPLCNRPSPARKKLLRCGHHNMERHTTHGANHRPSSLAPPHATLSSSSSVSEVPALGVIVSYSLARVWCVSVVYCERVKRKKMASSVTPTTHRPSPPLIFLLLFPPRIPPTPSRRQTPALRRAQHTTRHSPACVTHSPWFGASVHCVKSDRQTESQRERQTDSAGPVRP